MGYIEHSKSTLQLNTEKVENFTFREYANETITIKETLQPGLRR